MNSEEREGSRENEVFQFVTNPNISVTFEREAATGGPSLSHTWTTRDASTLRTKGHKGSNGAESSYIQSDQTHVSHAHARHR